MKPRHVQASTSLLIVLVMATVVWLNAGDLNPPVGPVAPTMKTLVEVEPRIAINATNTPGDADSLFKITQPGSYYLTGNITGVAGKHGIEIAAGGVKFAAGGVTLDLNGFDLLGFVGGTLDGVSATLALQSNIAVVNGSVRGWGDEGVDLGTLSADNCRVDGVLASGNSGDGIRIGDGSTVSNCSAYQNGSSGIVVTGDGCTVSNCSAYDNTDHGFTTVSGCTISNSSAYNNTSDGINTSSGCTVSNCSAFENTDNGISVSIGSTVVACTARGNTLDGIVCATACVIRGNTCSSNGTGDGAGIHATDNDNRIDGNNCTGADRGIDVDAAGNFITRNTCSGNTTNWDVAANNKCLVVLGVNAAAINGNSGGISPGSTDPNANFTY